MVVDDSSTILLTAKKFLEPAYEVFTVNDGYRCLAAVMDVRPDVLFLDITMPKLDGYQALAAIRDNPLFDAMPIIILSGKDSSFDKARGRMLGCSDYLPKPFERGSLIEMVRRHLPEMNA